MKEVADRAGLIQSVKKACEEYGVTEEEYYEWLHKEYEKTGRQAYKMCVECRYTKEINAFKLGAMKTTHDRCNQCRGI